MDRKNRCEKFLRTESARRRHLEIRHLKREKPARKTRAGSQLRTELSAAYAERNRRHADFRRHHRGCRLLLRCRHHHLGCHHHRRNFGSARNRSATGQDSSGPVENKSGARSTSSVLSTGAKAAECRSEPGVDCKSAVGKHHDCCRGTPASRDSSVAEARKNGRRSNSPDDCCCYSEAARCAGQSYSRRNPNGPPRRGDPGGACVLIAGADSQDDSVRRILSARGPDL